MNYNKLAKEIHENNVKNGWWPPHTCIYTKLQLISTEIAEATEGERKDLMDDHLPHRKMGEVELADTLIRTLDFGEYMGLKAIDDPYLGYNYSKTTKKTVGHMHLNLNAWLLNLYEAVEESPVTLQNKIYTCFVNTIVHTSDHLGYDIKNAIVEKLAYNQIRLDHKQSSRSEKNGKKF